MSAEPSLLPPRVELDPLKRIVEERDAEGRVVAAAPATFAIVEDQWRVVLVCEGQEPRFVGNVRRTADGRFFAVPDRVAFRAQATALRASAEEARAYFETFALAAKPRRAPKAAAPAAEPDLFSQS